MRSIRLRISMADQDRSFPFRWVLPSIQLVVCVALLWPVRGRLLFGVEDSVGSYSRPTPKGKVVLDPKWLVVPTTPELQRTDDLAATVADIRTKAPLGLNFPVLVAQLPYILVSPAKREWIPKGMFPDTWRALSWPLVGIFFWWFLGRSLEALPTARRSIAHPRISWIETACALILLGTGVVALVGILTSTPDDRRDVHFMTLLAGALLWGILATVTIVARFLQWRVAKRNAAPRLTMDASAG
jgi:hypothetical protein